MSREELENQTATLTGNRAAWRQAAEPSRAGSAEEAAMEQASFYRCRE